ncbi:MAG: 4Fe-4S binding protein [bacterium]
MMKKVRIISQVLFYLLFLFLLINTTYPLNIKGVDFFLTLSPLLGLTTSIACSKFLLVEFLPALVIVILTIILGRVFCGWVCPLGTTLELTDKLFKKRKNKNKAKISCLKYYLFILVLIISLFGINITGWLDPLSLITRTYSLVILPYLSFLIRMMFDSIYYLLPFLRLCSEPIYDFFKEYLIGYEQSIFTGHILIAIIFVIIVLLSILSRRYWCQNLCPLGAVLSLLSFKTLLKKEVNSSCVECDICSQSCKMNAVGGMGKPTFNGECIRCFSCQNVCQSNAVTFKFKISNGANVTSTNLSRRGFLVTLAGSLTLTPMLKLKVRKDNPTLIRPPGALVEEEFLSRCLRCGNCMKVCPTNGLQPTLLDAGLDGIWTPKLVSRIGYCEYNCILCSQVCPSGAIKKITLEEKKKIVIGVAVIDKDVCLPYAKNKECLVCEEMCPTPTKAIKFEKIKEGKKVIRRPIVLEKECIGCGICEYKCPLEGKSGIVIIKK